MSLFKYRFTGSALEFDSVNGGSWCTLSLLGHLGSTDPDEGISCGYSILENVLELLWCSLFLYIYEPRGTSNAWNAFCCLTAYFITCKRRQEGRKVLSCSPPIMQSSLWYYFVELKCYCAYSETGFLELCHAYFFNVTEYFSTTWFLTAAQGPLGWRCHRLLS